MSGPIPIMKCADGKKTPCCPYCDEAPLDTRKPLKDGSVLWDCCGCLGVWLFREGYWIAF